MKTVIAALLLGLCLSAAQAIEDGFRCRPYRNGNPAAATIYCAYLDNSSIKWEIWGSAQSSGEWKLFCKNVDSADVVIPHLKTYKFCAWNGTYRSEWTSPPVFYNEGVYDQYILNMNVYCPMAPDPNEEE